MITSVAMLFFWKFKGKFFPEMPVLVYKNFIERNKVEITDVCEEDTFESVEEFKYLGKYLTNKNSIAEEIKSRLRSGNACYQSVQNLLSSRLVSKNLKIKIYIEQ